jgi:hypothetical protein
MSCRRLAETCLDCYTTRSFKITQITNVITRTLLKRRDRSAPSRNVDFWRHLSWLGCASMLFVFLKRKTDMLKSYCLSDISPSRTHNRIDRSPGCRLCYVTEHYVPNVKDLGFRESRDESRPENYPERDLHRIWPESTVELHKLTNTLEQEPAIPAKPGSSRA